jgi:hypothetical protein
MEEPSPEHPTWLPLTPFCPCIAAQDIGQGKMEPDASNTEGVAQPTGAHTLFIFSFSGTCTCT